MSTPSAGLHQPVHYEKLIPWSELNEDHYCRRKAEKICDHVYSEHTEIDPDEDHDDYLVLNYCKSDLYDKCTRAREIGLLH